jgi:sugar/nucleoside kinase (ribokinase family)
MKPIIVVGETNVDVVLYGASSLPVPGHEALVDDCVLTLGSASAICAMGLARLGNPVSFVSRAGLDPLGDYCVGVLKSAGVDTAHVIRDCNLKTGLTIALSSAVDRALVTYVGSIAAVEETDVPDTLLAAAAHLHVSSYFLQSRLRPACARLFGRANARGLTTSLDPGFDPQQQWNGELQSAIQSADIFLPNVVELLAIAACTEPDEALRVLDDGRTRVVVKLGKSGAMTRDRGETLHAPAFGIQSIDTTGAGDSFNAGFLHAFVRGWPPLDCLIAGNACGALSTRALGGTAAQPSLEEMTNLIRTAQERQ